VSKTGTGHVGCTQGQYFHRHTGRSRATFLDSSARRLYCFFLFFYSHTLSRARRFADLPIGAMADQATLSNCLAQTVNPDAAARKQGALSRRARRPRTPPKPAARHRLVRSSGARRLTRALCAVSLSQRRRSSSGSSERPTRRSACSTCSPPRGCRRTFGRRAQSTSRTCAGSTGTRRRRTSRSPRG
jgi:hypothetical protein